MTDQPNGNLYHLILGLPEEVRSPNLYELLGLEGRTSDPQTIKNAAADQNRKLLSWQNSDRYAEVRALTFEVVKARDTLLNEEARAVYDLSLGDWGIVEDGPWIVEEVAPPESSSEPLSVRCPDCQADFKLRNRDLIGRRLPCPECGFRFKVRPEPATALLKAEPLVEESDSDAELTALDNFDDMEDLPAAPASKRKQRSRQKKERDLFAAEPLDDDYEDYESRNHRRSRNRGRNRTRSAAPSHRTASPPPKPRSPGKWILLGGGALMAVGVIVLVSALIQNMVSPSVAAHSDRLAYLPPDCQEVAYHRLGDVARSPFFQDHLTRHFEPRRAVDQFRERIGMELQDVDSMIVGLRNGHLSQLQLSVSLQRAPRGVSFVAVVRASKDWDRTKLIGEHTQSATHNNLTYHTFSPEGDSSETWAFYLPDARTLVFGTVPELQAALDTGGNSPDWPDTEFLDREYAIITTHVPDPPKISSSNKFSVPRPPDRSRARPIIPLQLGGGSLLEGNGVHRVSFLVCDSEAEAAEFIEQQAEQNFGPRGLAPSRPNPRRQNPRFAPPPGQPPWEMTAPGRRFEQYGRTVAVIGPSQNHLTPGLCNIPLNLLAHLGSPPATSSPPPNAADNPETNAATNPVVHTEPDNPKPNSSQHTSRLPPPPTLDDLVQNLKNDINMTETFMKLRGMQPVPERQKEVVSVLENIVRTTDEYDKYEAVDCLGVWGTSETVPFLLSLMNGNNTRLKKHVLPALGGLKDPRGLPILIDSLEDNALRLEALKGLGRYDTEVVEPELLKALPNSSWRTQQLICDFLFYNGTSRSLPQLDALVAEGSDLVKPRAKKAADAIRTRKP